METKMIGDPSFTPPPNLLDQVRDRLRVKHYSIRIEAQYLQWIDTVSVWRHYEWIRRFVLFHDKPHLINQAGQSNSVFHPACPFSIFGKSPAHLHLSEKITGTVTQASTG